MLVYYTEAEFGPNIKGKVYMYSMLLVVIVLNCHMIRRSLTAGLLQSLLL